MSDDRDFLEKTEQFWRNRGHEWSPGQAQEHFKLYGPRKRSEALDQLDAELRSVEPTMENLRKMTELGELRQDLDVIHHTLLKVRR
jgi:hypothetical protein